MIRKNRFVLGRTILVVGFVAILQVASGFAPPIRRHDVTTRRTGPSSFERQQGTAILAIRRSRRIEEMDQQKKSMPRKSSTMKSEESKEEAEEATPSDKTMMKEEQEEKVTEQEEKVTEQEEKVTEQPVSVQANGGKKKEESKPVPEPSKIVEENEEDRKLQLTDEGNMRKAIQMAQSAGGERGATSAYPNPTTGAVLIAQDGRVLGQGRSDYNRDSVEAVLVDAGLEIVPLREWCVTWPSSKQLRDDLAKATLYLTMEPSNERKGQSLPPVTQLIELSGVRRVVIGCRDPIPERASKGAANLHSTGIDVTMGTVLLEECEKLITEYSRKANSKLHRMARKHSSNFNRPLGFLHCSVVDSDNVEAFARHGNAFGKTFGSSTLSFRNFGAYEIAPPPETIWADEQQDDFETEVTGLPTMDAEDVDDIFSLDFDEENYQEEMDNSPVMPWYEQVDAVVATFPRSGNGPVEDDSLTARLNGLKWLATYGEKLPAGVERVLVMDATELSELPMSNDDPNLPQGVDVEAFWAGKGRKATRVLLRRGDSAQAKAVADAAARAAQSAAEAALAAKDAIETGDAEAAAEAAIECQQAAAAAAEFTQKELMRVLELKRKLAGLGVVVETVSGGEPVDVMKHLGVRNGYESVVWRAGCWGNRGVQAILDGAFQWVSAHLAVDAKGGKFWQLMLAERAIQAACGPESKLKVFASDEDISLEYCDNPAADSDCILTVDGRPIRHVRLDCRVALVDPDRQREFVLAKTKVADKKIIEEQAPWFL